MIDIIAAVSGGISQAMSVANSINQLNVTTEVNMRVNDMVQRLGVLAGQLVEAHAQAASLHRRLEDVEKENLRLKAFEEQKHRYTLKAAADDSYVYTLKNMEQEKEPEHSLCANCYDDSLKSILQFSRYDGRFKVLACHRCKAEIHIPHGIPQEAITVSTGRSVDFRGY